MIFVIILCILLLSIDFYTLRGLKAIQIGGEGILNTSFPYVFWSITLLAFLGLALILFYRSRVDETLVFPYLYYFTGFIAIFYLPKVAFIVFVFLDDALWLSSLGLSSIFKDIPFLKHMIEVFGKQRWLSIIGAFMAIIDVMFVLYGIAIGRFDYTVKNVEIHSKAIPVSFDGFKVLQFSDLHIGSFIGHENKLKEAVDFINAQQADVIVFTGDIVNNHSNELLPFVNTLKQLKAKYGIYSILGNHDYGDYVQWKSIEEKTANLDNLKRLHAECGFQLLLNSHQKIEKDNESITIIGVENWGVPPFPQHGNLSNAMEGTDENDFRILLSHDPSHWENEVIKKTNISLTLAGHTHGMQMGINLPFFKWSMVKYKYPRWNGLYTEGEQQLYVSIGLGFIGFPMRINMNPEVTIFKMHATP